jgi:hypothetical protein
MTASVQIAGARSAAGKERSTPGVPSAGVRRHESTGTPDDEVSDTAQNSVATPMPSFGAVLRQYWSPPVTSNVREPSARGAARGKSTKQTEDKPTPDTVAPAETTSAPREVPPFQWAVPFQPAAPRDADAQEPAQDQADSHLDQMPQSRTSNWETAIAPDPIPQTNPAAPAKPGDLAFAARLTLNQPPNIAPEAAPEATSRAHLETQPIKKQSAPDASVGDESSPPRKQTTPVAEPLAKPAVLTLAPQIVAAYASRPAPAASPAPDSNGMAAARVQEIVEARQTFTGPIQQITVRIPDASAGGTDVRFIDRGGEIHVSVRTADGETATALRGGLSDFVSRLDNSGIRAEVWHPGADASPSDSQQRSDSQEHSDSQRQPQHQGGSGRHNHNPGSGSRQQQPQDGPKPEWVEQLESSIGRTDSSTSARTEQEY